MACKSLLTTNLLLVSVNKLQQASKIGNLQRAWVDANYFIKICSTFKLVFSILTSCMYLSPLSYILFFIVVIHKTGRFHKTAAINEAAESVKNDNSIIFLLDLHLDLPVSLIHTIRKVNSVYTLK